MESNSKLYRTYSVAKNIWITIEVFLLCASCIVGTGTRGARLLVICMTDAKVGANIVQIRSAIRKDTAILHNLLDLRLGIVALHHCDGHRINLDFTVMIAQVSPTAAATAA